MDPGPAPLSPYALGAGSGWKAKCAAERQGAAGSGGRRLQSPPRQRTDAAATAAAPGASAPRSARPAAAITAAVRGHRRCRRRVPKRRGPAQASLLASSGRRTDQSEAALPWVGGWGGDEELTARARAARGCGVGLPRGGITRTARGGVQHALGGGSGLCACAHVAVVAVGSRWWGSGSGGFLRAARRGERLLAVSRWRCGSGVQGMGER